MIKIGPCRNKKATVRVPGSKSYTHRYLVASALSNGKCTINGPLISDDTLLTMGALKQMGIPIEQRNDRFLVQGMSGWLNNPPHEIDLGNSGTSMRLCVALASLGQGTCILTGTERMQQRPLQDLLDGLVQIGVPAESVRRNGCPPVKIRGGMISGGHMDLNCRLSSQFLSACLLIAPMTRKGLKINVEGGPVSKPYIDITVDVMERYGIFLHRNGYQRFKVAGRQSYQAGSHDVEPDCSQAGYFWGAAAVTGTAVKVKGTRSDSKQGDIRFIDHLEKMGCRVNHEPDGIEVKGPERLKAIQTDMSDLPDMVPTLAVVAAFAEGTTVISNVAHLKAKESDRLTATAVELGKMKIDARCNENELVIRGSVPRGANIETYDDHRMAMSFAMAGLKIPGIVIMDENCVSKSFPNYWDVLNQI
jgi:3-phosphoshikimate 1-carboxyvinyltransferase